jgi:ribosome biogenesis GTPase A
MAAGVRAVLSVADLIDVVIEVRDARLARSTAVAGLHPRLANKASIALLNRSDLAEPSATKKWIESLRGAGIAAYASDGTRAATLREVRTDLLARPRKRGVLRAAVVGAPNTGKSSVINALGRSKRAVVQDRAGITRHVRWLKLEQGVELLDTPGLLAPRIVSEDVAWQLAVCGSLPQTAFDVEETVLHFHRWLQTHRPRLAAKADLSAFAAARGMRRRGGELDGLNAARKFLSLFRAGELFRLTFELPEQPA